jgi:S1-C subfamily serine protease
VKWVAIALGVTMMLLVGVFAVLVVLAGRSGGAAARLDERAIVRVIAGRSSGTGFFVKAPKGIDGVLVVTAFHVVDSGEPAIVERLVGTSGKDSYLEAFPETEFLAFDADSDIAVLHVKRLPASLVSTLELTTDVVKDAPVVSAGFPASSITRRAGLIKKEGKLLEQAKLPVIDRAYGTLVRDNATPGLLVSSDIEPGFSGGPTCDDRGRVVGVNMLKDLRHRGQNGAVAAESVKALIDRIRPYTPPTAKDVEALLKRIQDQFLLLPVGDRGKVPEHELVVPSELPQIRQLIEELHGMEQEKADHDLGSGVKASSRALLGILLARLPGKSLETYYASSTQDLVRKCEDSARGVRRFLGEIDDGAPSDPKDCVRLAMRPLAWDLAAVTMEWGGAGREYTVTNLEEVDPEAHVFRASVRMSDLSSLVPVHVAVEAGVLRLKLFDENGRLYALEGSRSAVGHDFEGKWAAKLDRRPDPSIPGAEVEAEEHVSVSIAGTDSVTITSQFRATRRTTEKRALFACNRDSTVVTAGVESLVGKLHNGVVTGTSTRIDLSSDGCAKCGLCHPQSKIFVAKLQGGHLVLYATNGAAPPEPLELTRE